VASNDLTKAKAAAARARLDDPEEHFPYRRDDALAALREGPEPGTNNHPQHWYTSEQIIEATAAYVAAQQAHLEDITDDAKREAYRNAASDLDIARGLHRSGRPNAPLAVAGNPNDIEQRNDAARALAKQGYDAPTIANLLGRNVTEIQAALNTLED